MEKITKKKKLFIIIVITIIIVISLIISVGFIYQFTLSNNDGPDAPGEYCFAIKISDSSEILTNNSTSQNICYIEHVSGGATPWSMLQFQISVDANKYVNVSFEDDKNIVKMRKVQKSSGDPDLWEVGDMVIFSENGLTNWDKQLYPKLYMKIVYKPQPNITMNEENVLLG
jgi:hypothetical protein